MGLRRFRCELRFFDHVFEPDSERAASDPIGGGTGWCNMQTMIVGGWPDLGLAEEASFI